MAYLKNLDPSLEAAHGRVSGYEQNPIYGHNDDLDTGDGEKIIWDYQASGWSPLSSSDTVDLTSTSGNDVSGGTGAEKITVYGLLSGAEVSEEVTMTAGTNRTTQTFDYVNKLEVTQAGSGQTNAGDIRCFATAAGNTLGFISSGSGESDQLKWVVKDGYSAYIQKIYFAADKTSGVADPTVWIRLWKVESGVKKLLFADRMNTAVSKAINPPPFENPLKIEGGGYWYVTAETDKNDTFVRGVVEQTLIQD